MVRNYWVSHIIVLGSCQSTLLMKPTIVIGYYNLRTVLNHPCAGRAVQHQDCSRSFLFGTTLSFMTFVDLAWRSTQVLKLKVAQKKKKKHHAQSISNKIDRLWSSLTQNLAINLCFLTIIIEPWCSNVFFCFVCLRLKKGSKTEKRAKEEEIKGDCVLSTREVWKFLSD